MQSPGRSDHSRDDSLIADDASSTGNKEDDDDDDEDDANDENDGFSRDPERLKAFNVSNLIYHNISSVNVQRYKYKYKYMPCNKRILRDFLPTINHPFKHVF